MSVDACAALGEVFNLTESLPLIDVLFKGLRKQSEQSRW